MISDKAILAINILIISILVVTACKNNSSKQNNTENPQQEFIEKLKKNNQKEIKCKVLESPTGENSSLKNAAIRKNAEEDVFIELSFTNNSSINLIITQLENELLLKHDVRQENLMPAENTMYGGFSKDRGTSTHQTFPVHNFGMNMWPEYEATHWEIFWDKNDKELHYQEWNQDSLNRHYVLLL